VIRCSRPCSQRPGKWLWVRRPPCCAGSDLELSGWVPLKAPPLSSRGMNPGATPTSSLSRFDQAEFCRGHPFWAVETNDLSLVRGLGLNDFLHWVKPRCGLPSNRERGTPSPNGTCSSPCPSRVHLGTQGDPAAQIPEEDDPGHEEEDGGAGDCSPGRAPRGWNSSFMPKPCSSQGSFVSTG
jgi:hypothetical protein